MEKTSERDAQASVKSNANDVSFEATQVVRNPPALQLKSEDKSSDKEGPAESETADAPFQFDSAESSPPPIQNKSITAPFQFKSKQGTVETEDSDGTLDIQPYQLAAEGSGNPCESTPSGSGNNDEKPNNTGLPTQLKSGVESLSGFSLDDVKVHRNSDKPAQLQAHAYAQGTDIHLGPGQEQHLPHEAWHVVQQKQGRVQATKQMKAFNVNDDVGLEKEADVMGAKAMQLKAYGVKQALTSQINSSNSPVQMVGGQSGGTGAPGYFATKKSERDARKTDRVARKQDRKDSTSLNAAKNTLVANDDLGSTEASGGSNHDVLSATSGSLSKLALGTNEVKSQHLTTEVDVAVTLPDGTITTVKREQALAGNSEANIAGNSAAGLAGFMDICMTIKDMKDNGAMNPKMIDQMFGLVKSGASVVKSVSSAAKAANNSGEAVAEYAGSVAAGVNVLKNFVKMVTNIYKDYKAATSDVGMGGAEKFEAVASALQQAISTVGSSLGFAKSVMGLMGMAKTVAMDELKKFIPGVNILMNGVNIAMEVYSIVKSETARRKIRAEKKGLKGTYEDQMSKETKYLKRRKTSQKEISQSLAQLEIDDGNSNLFIAGLQQSMDSNSLSITAKKALINQTEQKLNRKKKGKRLKKSIRQRLAKTIQDAKDELQQLENQQTDMSDRKTSEENKLIENNTAKDDLEHISFLQSMQKLNKNRNADSIFKIGTELVSMAGDIATLTGVGAAAGTPLKLIASGATIAKSGAGAIRQKGRNAAEAKYKKRVDEGRNADEKSITEKVFNKDKSDAGLKEAKLKNAQHILKMYSNISSMPEEKHAEEKTRLEDYIKAAGAHPNTVYRAFHNAQGSAFEAEVPATKFKKAVPEKPAITDEQAKISAFLSTIAGAM